jgi:succinyl-CoA synthetase beta subunit
VDLYEYQGKELFRRFQIPVSEGRLATTPEEARAAAEQVGGPVVVKAQVLTGGRGKAGGVKLADDPADAEQKAREILGLDIRGHVVRKLWIERASEIAKEYYLSITFDRGAKKPLFMLTKEGGVEIEQVAEESPEKLARLHVDPLEGFRPWQARHLIYGAAIDDPNEQKQLLGIIEKLYRCFVECDAMLTEINPLIVTPEGEVKALDSKFTVDENALYKHPDIAEMRDVEAADPLEALAREKGVTYVKLDGDVGILGNGAGLSMSTVDVVAHVGGRPANFCDLGGGGDAEGVVDALEVITRDPQVRSIFFNIFGGITRCDEVARGILTALERMQISQPIVVRLDGTNAEEARRILQGAGKSNVFPEATMLDGARRAVELAERRMTDIWGARAQAYRQSETHASGSDLDQLVEWCEPAEGVKVLDVATGGGHVARRLRERGCEVVTLDPSAGMQPDVVGRAEELPFDDGSFEVVVSRIAPHHFEDVRRSVCEMARVARRLVVIEDTLFSSDRQDEAERLRDPSHVRSYTEDEWRGFFLEAGLEPELVDTFEKTHPLEEWLARTGCEGENASRVRELLADRMTPDGTAWTDTKLLIRARKSQR